MRRSTLRMLAVPAAIVVACLVAFAALPPAGTGAYWTTAAAGASSATGTAQWCSTPDPAVSGGRYIRLSTITTLVTSSTTQRIAIVPVANNAAWSGGSGTPTLTAKLWGCQTASTMPADALRVTSWSNPSGTIPTETFLSGSTVAPATRLDPATGLGAQLTTLATAASVDSGAILVTAGGDARRFSWIISSGRTNTATGVGPPPCVYVLLNTGGCSFTMGTDQAFSSLFTVLPWNSATLTSATYAAQTAATQTTGGWAANGSPLSQTCTGLGLINCTTNSAPTIMKVPTASDLLHTTDGNQLQWVVIDWTGSTAPPSDLVLEIVLQ